MKIIHYDGVTGEKTTENNPSQPKIPNHSDNLLIIGTSRSWTTNTLINSIDHEGYIHIIYFYALDPYGATHQLLKMKVEGTLIILKLYWLLE